MKKLCSLFVLLCAVLTVSAQKFEPNTKWPYLYEDFTQGTIFFNGNKKSEAKLNIHLWGNKLHYLKGDNKIYQSDDRDVIRVEIGSDAFIYSDHQLMKILSADNNNLLVVQDKADFDALFANTGAYGASLNSSAARDLSSLELGGLDTPELGLLLQERHDGRAIDVKQVYFFIIDGQQVEANKKEVEKLLSDNGKKEWKSFQKDNKIKWKNEESLLKVLSFINANKK